MKTIILGGFLGSGKTTALMKLARFLTEISGDERESRVVILENEVGQVGIDDKFLRGGGFAVDNLFSGCACCTVSGELIAAVTRIRDDLNPEWLIIETTGLAYPISMRDNLRGAMGIEPLICILADASRWSRLLIPMNSLLRGQIVGSDTVLINKTDLADDPALEKMERDILEMEPHAAIFRICAASTVPDEVWRGVIEAKEQI